MWIIQGGFVNIDKYISSDKTLNKFISNKLTKQQNTLNDTSKEVLARCRKKLAQRIDGILGTNLVDVKLSKPIKIIEKTVSQKIFRSSGR